MHGNTNIKKKNSRSVCMSVGHFTRFYQQVMVLHRVALNDLSLWAEL